MDGDGEGLGGTDGMDGGQATHMGACHMCVWARMGTERVWVGTDGMDGGPQRSPLRWKLRLELKSS